MGQLEAIDAGRRQHPPHRPLEDGPLVLEVEVVDDEKAALLQVEPKSLDLRLVWIPVPGLGQIGEWMLEQARIVERA